MANSITAGPVSLLLCQKAIQLVHLARNEAKNQVLHLGRRARARRVVDRGRRDALEDDVLDRRRRRRKVLEREAAGPRELARQELAAVRRAEEPPVWSDERRREGRERAVVARRAPALLVDRRGRGRVQDDDVKGLAALREAFEPVEAVAVNAVVDLADGLARAVRDAVRFQRRREVGEPVPVAVHRERAR